MRFSLSWQWGLKFLTIFGWVLHRPKSGWKAESSFSVCWSVWISPPPPPTPPYSIRWSAGALAVSEDKSVRSFYSHILLIRNNIHYYFHRNPVINNLYPLKDCAYARKTVSHVVLDRTWSAKWSSSQLTYFYITCHHSNKFSFITVIIFQFKNGSIA